MLNLNTQQRFSNKTNFINIDNFASSKITRREKKTLVYLLKGASAKIIAKQMNISHRTVEEHIASLKNKFSCYSVYELRQCLWNSTFPYKYIMHLMFGDANPADEGG